MGLSPERLEAEVTAFARTEGRRPGTTGHREAQAYLVRRMTEIGLHFYRGGSFALPYSADGMTFANLIGELPGTNRSLPRVLLGAHYDSVIAAPCADDNAAAVAILLAIAEQLRTYDGRRGIVFAFFDAEEPPYFLGSAMGSIRFYTEQMREDGVAVAIIMDLVGHDVTSPLAVPDVLFLTGAESDPQLPEAVLRARGELPLIATQSCRVGDLSDYHIFRRHEVPYLFLTCGRWEHYHKPTDVPSQLNYRKTGKIGEFLQRLTLDLAQAEWGTASAIDTTAFELALLDNTLGSRLPALLQAIGMTSLRTRVDLDAFVMRLQSRFGL